MSFPRLNAIVSTHQIAKSLGYRYRGLSAPEDIAGVNYVQGSARQYVEQYVVKRQETRDGNYTRPELAGERAV